MNNVLTRILSQIKRSKFSASKIEKPKKQETPQEITPFTPEDLREELQKSMQETESLPVSQNPAEHTFDGISNFTAWYRINQSSFNESQIAALNSLISAESAIHNGCNCKKKRRESAANEYYKNFFLNNQKTDIPPRIKEILGVNVVRFCVNNEAFLVV